MKSSQQYLHYFQDMIIPQVSLALFKRKFIAAVFVLGISASSLGQNPVSLRWDYEVGCQIANPENEGPDRKYEELIESNSCLIVCENAIVEYDLSSDDNSGWLSTVWHVAGGVILSQSTGSCRIKWGTFGSGSIGASVTTDAGVLEVAQLCVDIIKGPKAGFGIIGLQPAYNVCRGQQLQFINNSSANGGSEIVSYHWQFAGQDFSTEENPIYSFQNPGVFDVLLTVRNACNCTSSSRLKVTVQGLGINIECPGVICENDTAFYSIPSDSECRAFDWSVDGGTILSPQPYGNRIEVRWDQVPDSGFGTVSFNGADCRIECGITSSVRIPVVRDKIPISGEISPCSGSQYKYSLPMWPSTRVEWLLEGKGTLIYTDQPNEVIIQVPGKGLPMTLTAKYQNTLLNCGGISATLEIVPKKTAYIRGDAEICVGTHTYSIYTEGRTPGLGIIGDWQIQNSTGTIIAAGTSRQISANFPTPGVYTLTVTTNSYCPIPPMKIRVLPPPAAVDATDVFGKWVVCPGVPEPYRIVNTVPGTLIRWDAEGGAFAGSTYGNDVTVTFNPAYTGTYKLKLWREYMTAPHCSSEVEEITILRPDTNLQIVATGDNIDRAHTPCPSTYQQYSVEKVAVPDVPYTEGEVYNWSIEDPTAGSVTAIEGMADSGDGTPNIRVLWNQFETTVNTRLVLRIRKCNQFIQPPMYFDITINPVPDLTIDAPDEICTGTPFYPQLVPVPDEAIIKWYVDGAEWDGSQVSFMNNTWGTEQHELKAVLTNFNGCPTAYTFTKTITVFYMPFAQVMPHEGRYYCAPFQTYPLDLFPIPPTGTEIKWYRDSLTNLEQSGSGPLAYHYTVTTPGTYFAVLSNEQCSFQTEGITRGLIAPEQCVDGEPQPPCEFAVQPTLGLNAVQTDCYSYTITAANPGAFTVTPVWGNYGSACSCTGQVTNASPTAATFTFSKPALYSIGYSTAYAAASGTESCEYRKSISVIVPYMAAINFKATCNSGTGQYAVTLEDESEYYLHPDSIGRTYYLNDVELPDPQVSLSPGTYTIKIKLSRTGYADCIAEKEIVLPLFPDASFTYTSATCSSACGSICSNKAIKLHVTNPQPGETYEWDFGDSKNLVRDAEKVYIAHGPELITLKVKNEFGCIATETKSLQVRQDLLNGSLSTTPNPGINCENIPIILKYVADTGSEAATHFIWMNGSNPVPSAPNTPTLIVNQSGAYWVKTRDQFGCTSETGTANATFVMVPDAIITGPDAVCIDQPFTLSGYAGGSTTEYQWLHYGDPLGPFSANNTELRQVANGDNSHEEYTLRVRVPSGPGQYCISEVTKTVQVVEPPAIPVIEIVSIQCSPYSITVRGISNEMGSFNWSNGMSEADTDASEITVNNGGALQLRFTSAGGCSSTALIDLPKDPETFLWLFPSGCYAFCPREQHVIMAPVPSFNEWSWIMNQDVSHPESETGVGNVPDYAIPDGGPDGHITQRLTVDSCEKESRPLVYTMEQCEECDGEVQIRLRSIERGNRPFCSYDFTLEINNQSAAASASVTTNETLDGFLSPTQLTVPHGIQNYAFTFVPDSNFSDSSITVRVVLTLRDGRKCWVSLTVDLPFDCPGTPFIVPGGSITQRGTQLLKIAPNPASHQTTIAYAFDGTANNQLLVYDLSGRELAKHRAPQLSGNWILDTSSFRPGYYIVVAEQDGQLISQQKLAIQ